MLLPGLYVYERRDARQKVYVPFSGNDHVYQRGTHFHLYCHEILRAFEYLLDLYPAHDDFRIQYCADKDLHGIAPGLEESAMLDGAGDIKVFTSIILPLSKPIIATVAVFVAVGHWNSWFDNHIYTRGESSLTTLQYLLYNYLNESQRLAEQIKNTSNLSSIENAMGTISPKGVRMTITVLASLPIFMVYPFMQKYFVKGIMIGAVKG